MKVPILLDGAWGTGLRSLGWPAYLLPDLCNIENPELVLQLATGYVEAGSQILLTNTFGANEIALKESGLQDAFVGINKAAVKLARSAGGGHLVYGSIGPTRLGISEFKSRQVEAAQAFHDQAEMLSGWGVDAIVLETFSNAEELITATRAIMPMQVPVWACCVNGNDDRADFCLDGTPLRELALRLQDLGCHGVGINCGWGPLEMMPAIAAMRSGVDLPIWAKPNAGIPTKIPNASVEGDKLSNDGFTYPLGPDEWAEKCMRLVGAGVSCIGGCCGAHVAHVMALHSRLRGIDPSNRSNATPQATVPIGE